MLEKQNSNCFDDWALANRLSINADKTFCIIFGNSSVDIDAPNFVFGNAQIEAKSRSGFLGILLVDNMKINHHITFIESIYCLEKFLFPSCDMEEKKVLTNCIHDL